jgi:hypothetical protein
MKIFAHAAVVLALTLLTQVGGLAWLIALALRRRFRFLPALLLAYAAIWLAAVNLAPAFGRVPLPCRGEALRMQSAFYCVTLRHFVVPELAEAAADAAARVAQTFPGTVTLALDGGFPFAAAPMLPHLSHGDGRSLDVAFFYTGPDGAYLPGRTRSALGYFAFEGVAAGEPDPCLPAWPTLRWSLGWLQPLWPDRPLEALRTRALVLALAEDRRIGRLFLEPPLAARLGLSHPRLGIQGCRAARHDDHLHVQL